MRQLKFRSPAFAVPSYSKYQKSGHSVPIEVAEMVLDALPSSDPNHGDLSVGLTAALAEQDKPSPLMIEAETLHHFIAADLERGRHAVRLAAVLMQLAKPVPLDVEELALRELICADPTRRDLLVRLSHVLAEQGKAVPAEIEEKALHHLIACEPDRADLSVRLSQLLALQGKTVPLRLEETALNYLRTVDPSQTALTSRLAFVLHEQGKLMPPDVEEAALRSVLEATPERDDLAARLFLLTASNGARLAADLEERALKELLREHPARADLARMMCANKVRRGVKISQADIDCIFPRHPGGTAVQTFISSFYDDAFAIGDLKHIVPLLEMLQARFDDCPIILHYYVSALFHANAVLDALDVIEKNLSIISDHDYLCDLSARVHWYADKHEISKQRIVSFFSGYDGDLWRSQGFSRQQDKAIARGIPSLLIVTLPKSGSLFLLNTLARGLDVPFTFLCPLGMHPDLLIEQRVRDFRKGGCVAVDHIRPTQRNLEMLYNFGIRKIVFHFRDPRQAALSFVHHSFSDEIYHLPRSVVLNGRREIQRDPSALETSYLQLLEHQLSYLADWAGVIASDSRFDFKVTVFDDLDNEEELFQRLLNFFAVPGEAFDYGVLETDRTERAGHFRKGLRAEWREVLSPDCQQKMSESVHAAAIETLIHRYDTVARQG